MSHTLFAQKICLTNPDFEGQSAAHQVAPGWSIANGTTPDVQPGQWGITVPASTGNTYQGFVGDGTPGSGNWQEKACQLVPGCFQAGVKYKLEIDLVNIPVNGGGIGNADSCLFGVFAMWGGNNCNHQGELFFDTIVRNPTWQTYSFQFTPTQTWCYLTIGHNGNVVNPKSSCSNTNNPYSYFGVDNLSCFLSTKEVVSTDVTCFNQCNGTAKVKIYGGVPPFTYLWSPSGQTTDSIGGLCAGVHYVTITDSTGAVF
ncbi:MAG: SprB repeat-containing protein, partial [Bacteroidetes bacterium]|nr:SprB repeat-containing protein [Bacteroidota bacterium]